MCAGNIATFTKLHAHINNMKNSLLHLEDNIKTKLGSEGVDWIHLAQDKVLWRTLVNTVINLQV
jgi:hypothetical protein